MGGYWEEENVEIVRMVKTALKDSRDLQAYQVFFKTHPATEFRRDAEVWEGVENIAVLAKQGSNDYEFAVGPGHTAGLVDTYALGIRTIGIVHPCDVNNSPLKGMSEALFASSAAELSDIFRSYQELPKFDGGAENFFWFDERLTRWLRIIDKAV